MAARLRNRARCRIQVDLLQISFHPNIHFTNKAHLCNDSLFFSRQRDESEAQPLTWKHHAHPLAPDDYGKNPNHDSIK